MGSIGWVRSSACTWLFSSTHNTSALPGGFKYSPDNVADFFDEERVIGQLERLAAMRLQAEQTKVTLDGTLRDTRCRGRAAHTPMRRVLWTLLENLVQQACNLVIVVRARPTRLRQIIQPDEPVGAK